MTSVKVILLNSSRATEKITQNLQIVDLVVEIRTGKLSNSSTLSGSIYVEMIDKALVSC